MKNLFRSISPYSTDLWGILLYLRKYRVSEGTSVPEDEKGTPVRIRDYTRSCKFCKQTVLSKATVRDDGKAYGWNESEDLPGRITGVSLREQRRAGDDSHIQ